MTQLLAGLVNTLVPALVLTAAAWLFLRLFPGLNASTRYAAWWVVLVAVLALPLTQWRSAERLGPMVTSTIPAETEAVPVPAPMAAAPAAPVWELPIRIPAGKTSLVLAALWAAGTLAGLLRLLLGYFDLRGIVRRARPIEAMRLDRWTERFGVRRPVQLLASDEIGSPLAAGFLRPAVLVPESLLSRLDNHLADHVVIHELAHLGRRDDWANLLGRLLAAALWFHPVLRWILKRLEFERELACDDWVVTATASRRDYAESLTRLAEWRMDTPAHTLAASMVGQGSQVGRRVRSLLDPQRNAALGVSRLALALAAALAAGLLLGAAQTPGLVDFADAEAVDETFAPEAPEAPQAPSSTPAAPAPPASRAPASPASPPSPPSPPAPVSPPSPPSFLAALASAGYGNLDVDEVVELKLHGVNADFIRQMNAAGFGKMTTRQLTELRIHGLSPAYLAELQKAGITGYSLEQAKELKIHGVNPGEVAAIHALGFGPYTARQITEFKIHGVREEFFRALKNQGFGDASARDIVEARIHGVSARTLRDAQQYGNPKDLRRVMKLKQAGVL